MRLARSTGAVAGLLIVLLGIWGVLIPFVGPYFDYSFGVNSTWHYTTDRLWLDILPGVVALLGGLLLLFATTRAAGMLGGWLAVLAGAWFVIGPAVSLTWERGSGPIGPPLYGSTRRALESIGYFYGLGALIIALAAFATGRFASRPALAEEAPSTGAAPADAPGAGQIRTPPVPTPATPTQTLRTPAPAGRAPRRRFPFLRRGARAS
jgi:hypothetical protein